MSIQLATRSSKHPLGGISRDWPRRLLRFHVPLALASAVALVLFMGLSPFDLRAYPMVDMEGGVFPRPMDMDMDMAMYMEDDGEGQAAPSDHGGGQAGSMDHGGGQADPMDESGDQSADHGGGQADPMDESGGQSDQGGGQAGSMDEGEGQAAGLTQSHEERSPSFLQRVTVASGYVNVQRLTVATGYVATGFLALTLLIGPANLLLRKRNPVSSYLRRDVGTWTAIFSVVHVIFGLQAHGGGQLSAIRNYFFARDGSLWTWRPSTSSFGLANWTGLAALVIVVGLLALSNDVALRKLKTRTWKRLQRLNYALFALVIAHAFFYGALLRLESPFTLLLGLSVIAVFVGQAVGIRLWRRRYARTAATAVA